MSGFHVDFYMNTASSSQQKVIGEGLHRGGDMSTYNENALFEMLESGWASLPTRVNASIATFSQGHGHRDG